MSVENNDALKEQVNRLRKREGLILNSQKDMDKKLDILAKDIHIIKTVIVGDPLEPDKPGVTTRLDRIEQSEKIRARILWAVGTGFIGLVLERMKGWIP